jgi:hypothetical protein
MIERLSYFSLFLRAMHSMCNGCVSPSLAPEQETYANALEFRCLAPAAMRWNFSWGLACQAGPHLPPRFDVVSRLQAEGAVVFKAIEEGTPLRRDEIIRP